MDRGQPSNRGKTLEQIRDDALNQGSRRAKMPGDRPKFSDREKEKAASQPQTRYFIRARSQKQYETGRLKLNKKRAILKGGMEKGESSNQNKTLEQQRDDAMNKAEAITAYKESWAYYFDKRGHRDEDTYLDDMEKIDQDHTRRVEAIQYRYEEEKSKEEGSKKTINR